MGNKIPGGGLLVSVEQSARVSGLFTEDPIGKNAQHTRKGALSYGPIFLKSLLVSGGWDWSAWESQKITQDQINLLFKKIDLTPGSLSRNDWDGQIKQRMQQAREAELSLADGTFFGI